MSAAKQWPKAIAGHGARGLKQADACWIEQPCGCPDFEDGQTGKELPCVEDGSQLTLMHRYTILWWCLACHCTRSGHG
ncbi:MAG TPA: hypothetical protein ENJ35_00300 [Gammaproteobacteria bacterium]|nr:hypothetical protein [Gammaproteobacteria bacterium]